MAIIPASYEDSRIRFRESLRAFQRSWQHAHLTSIPLSGQQDLTIDVISADPIQIKDKLLILTTGLHGIEGYVGSGILQLFTDEILSRVDPNTTGVVIVHPINPFGMKYWTRVNKNSVDLNRNFNNDFDSLKLINPEYEKLGYLLNPGRALKNPLYEKVIFGLNVMRAFSRGAGFIRETALMGQYRVGKGMYFGGFNQQEETQQVMNLLDRTVKGYAHAVALDIHTGYGPRWQLTLINPSKERRSSEEIASRYKLPRVVGTNPDEFYTMHGEMTDYIFNLLKSDPLIDDFYVGSFEFGSYGDSLINTAHSLRTTILENSLRWFGGNNEALAWMKKEYKELFLPSDPAWWEKAQFDARHYLERILGVEEIIS